MMKRVPASEIQFNYLVDAFKFPNRNGLKTFLIALFKKEQAKLQSLTYIFCSDAYLLDINMRFLQHDYYTDIITFNLAEKGEKITGEVYISIDRVKENARVLGESFQAELHRVIFHGALHLCGYRDKSRREISIIREKESFYLQQYFLR